MTTEARQLPNQKYLASVFEYNAEAGLLVWKRRDRSTFKSDGSFKSWNTRFSGKVAGSQNGQGYRQVDLDGKVYLAHRIIWTLVNGDIGAEDIDHLNGDRSDNRIENLRVVSRSVNLRNSARIKPSQLGICGVSVHKATGKYRAYVGVNGKQIHLGFFDDLDAAIEAREEANSTYGFTKRHGT